MINKTRWTTVLGLGAVVMAGGLAQAQEPGMEGGPADAGTITNEQMTVDTTTTVTAPPQDDSILVVEDDFAAAPNTLADTGGAPLLMSLSGMLMAGGAFMLRRKLS